MKNCKHSRSKVLALKFKEVRLNAVKFHVLAESGTLTVDEIKALRDRDGYIDLIVPVDFDFLMHMDVDDLNNIVEEHIVGDNILSDIAYSPVGVGVKEGVVYVRVTAEVTLLDEEDEQDGK